MRHAAMHVGTEMGANKQNRLKKNLEIIYACAVHVTTWIGVN